MKLLTKTSLIIVTATMFVFFLCGALFYKMVNYVIDNNIKATLVSNLETIKFALRNDDNTAAHKNILRNYEVHALDSEAMVNEALFGDTLLWDSLARVTGHTGSLRQTLSRMAKHIT
ncbi:MAG: hypothetical protein HC896_07710 [Bacteroidales bacterium]|nr:hypothetical protein [Bacteroidales bacterium]